jgi:hypothetical protein
MAPIDPPASSYVNAKVSPFLDLELCKVTDASPVWQIYYPLLPYDVIYVIACHLAGIYAFGTLANLHIVSHHVADTVLPVLYETVLMDNAEKMPFPEDGQPDNPARFRYTK